MAKKQDNNDKKKNENKIKIILSIIGLILLVAIVSIALISTNNTEKNDDKELAYTDLIRNMSDGEVEEITMEVGSTKVKVKLKDVEEEKTSRVPNTQAFIELVQDKVAEGNNIKVNQIPQNMVATVAEKIVSFLPTILLLVFIILALI